MAVASQAIGTPRSAIRRSAGEVAGTLRRVAANPTGAISLLLVVALVVCAAFAPLIAPYDPIALNPRIRLQGPSWAHWLGTDQLGRDVLSRLIYGTSTALRVAVLGTGGALLVGATLGMIAALAPRLIDGLLILVCDAAKSLPMILFALAVVAIYGPSLVTLIGIIVFSMAPGYFRIVRSQALVLRNADFVVAARAMGASPLRLALSHLLPNLVGPLLVLVAMDIPAVIGIEAGLSFLGQGVQPPDPSWGTMLSDGYAFVRQAPHIAITAGIPIVIATIAFTFLGEALRDAFDPRSARARR
ncbi:ABC transporter permease [Devosia sp. A16]|uniref:ABC transporter permease n=1 Tax=Devosia sp. A16 TaxID=1736675 RepID=UPI0009E86FDE|nr:ABC transporter permease [Devosia sp. A16]